MKLIVMRKKTSTKAFISVKKSPFAILTPGHAEWRDWLIWCFFFFALIMQWYSDVWVMLLCKTLVPLKSPKVQSYIISLFMNLWIKKLFCPNPRFSIYFNLEQYIVHFCADIIMFVLHNPVTALPVMTPLFCNCVTWFFIRRKKKRSWCLSLN